MSINDVLNLNKLQVFMLMLRNTDSLKWTAIIMCYKVVIMVEGKNVVKGQRVVTCPSISVQAPGTLSFPLIQLWRASALWFQSICGRATVYLTKYNDEWPQTLMLPHKQAICLSTVQFTSVNAAQKRHCIGKRKQDTLVKLYTRKEPEVSS